VFDGSNLGVGATSLSDKLTVGDGTVSADSTVRINGGSNTGKGSGIRLMKAGSAYAYIGATSWLLGTGTSSNLSLSTTGSADVNIDSSGNLLVGTTTASYPSSGRGNITVGGSSSALYALQTGGTQKGYLYHDSTDMYLFSNASGRITITPQSSGVYLANGATSWTSNSDERKKDIIEPILNAVTKVSTLRAVIGKYKTDNDGRRRSFLIAQDVQAVLPEAVDASNPDDLGVQYTEVIPLLVAAIKEQSALITQLQADVAALKGASA
jgi:hypothetical protein